MINFTDPYFWLIALSILIGFFLIFFILCFFCFRFLLKNQLTIFATQILQQEPKSLTYLQNLLLDISERTSKHQSETKETIQSQITRNSIEFHDRIIQILSQNRNELQNGLLKSTQALETKFQSLEKQVNQRLELITQKVEAQLNENLKQGFKHFEKVQEHLHSAELKLASLNIVGQSISDLNQLLKLPHLRGGFGEATLERLLADFLTIGNYELEYRIDPNTTERVDAVVKFSQKLLPIDSKFPREQILPLFHSDNPKDLEEARKNLSDFIKTQAKTISQKYIRPELGTMDMALLFLPSETIYFEIIRNQELFETLSKLKVFPVSPNTLSISLKSVSIAQEYYEMSKGVEKTIDDIKKARRHFSHFERKFDDVGKGLRKAQEAYDTANTHLGNYGNSVFRLTGDSSETHLNTISLEHSSEMTSTEI